MMTSDEMIAVISAHREGKTIQCKTKSNNSEGWINQSHIHSEGWRFDLFEYRVAPEPLEAWVNVYEDNYLGWAYKAKEDADASASKTRLRCVHMREVI